MKQKDTILYIHIYTYYTYMEILWNSRKDKTKIIVIKIRTPFRIWKLPGKTVEGNLVVV